MEGQVVDGGGVADLKKLEERRGERGRSREEAGGRSESGESNWQKSGFF